MTSSRSLCMLAVVLALGAVKIHQAVRSEDAEKTDVDLGDAQSASSALLESDKLLLENYMSGEGDPCTQSEMETVWERFELGKENDKMCKDQAKWGHEVSYEHPTVKETIALYLYPKDDHNGAFGFCIGKAKTFDRHFCKRLKLASDNYSVRFWRVGSVQEAQMRVDEIANQGQQVKHLVLGGHGAPFGLWWGADNGNDCLKTGPCTVNLEVNTEKSNEFLCHARNVLSSLDGGSHASTVFLDSCLNGKRISGTNMVQYVAHKLSGAAVSGSKVSFSSEQVSVWGKGLDFQANIHEGRRSVINQMQHMAKDDAFHHWDIYDDSLCTEKDAEPTAIQAGDQELHECYKACAAKQDCQAITFYEHGKILFKNKAPSKTHQCYLSSNCEYIKNSQQGAVTFVKREPPQWDSGDVCPPAE